ncbi:MAG: DUF354 domain-containing protein [Bacteroidetes bacterium]|nr:DUF354 domain-containing protein [Bacteroidota bacterium]
MKTILIDIGHPAHVHLFRNLYALLIQDSFRVIVSVRKKEYVIALLNHYNIEHVTYGTAQKGLMNKIINWFSNIRKLSSIHSAYKPIISIGNSSFYAAQVALWHKTYAITLEDTGNKDQVLLYKYITDLILSPSLLSKNFGTRQIKYPGIDEMTYLHPNYYKPDRSILNELSLEEGDCFSIIRFIAHHASHEIGDMGIKSQTKIGLINTIASFGPVFITSEDQLPSELEKYQYPLPPETIHHAIYYSSLVFGESSTMSSEAAILGTPFVFINESDFDYTTAFEVQYQLGYNFTGKSYSIDKAIVKAAEILCANNKSEYQKRAKKFISESIDVTAFLFWLITNYPQSINQLKTDPNVFDPFYN